MLFVFMYELVLNCAFVFRCELVVVLNCAVCFQVRTGTELCCLFSGMNPEVDTSYLPDRDRDEEENKLR